MANSSATRKPTPADDKPSRPRRVTGRLRTACDLMVYEGMSMYDAARKAGISAFSMREALKKAHVIGYLREHREILRVSMCGANLLALAEVRDQQDNQNARVAAVNSLERMGEANSAGRSGLSQTPGFVIVLQQVVTDSASLTAHERQIEAKPLISLDCGHTAAVRPGQIEGD